MPVPARLQRWLPLIQKYATKWGVPVDLMAAIIDFESGGDPNAGHRTSGATGLGQVMPREAGFPGRPTKQELLDPETNLDWSGRIMADAWKRWGTPQQTAAAYLGALDRNGNVTNAADANGTTGHAYVQKIMGNLQAFGADVKAAAGQGLQQTPVGQGLRAFLDSLPPPEDARWGAGGDLAIGSSGAVGSTGAVGRAGGRVWPVAGQRPGAVVNQFGGTQFHSAGSEGLNLPATNTGADLTAPYGSSVVAETDGEVVEVYQALGDSRSGQGRNAKENYGYGGSVIVRYADGSKARYSHLATGSAAVRPGQRVTGGQLLGLAGDSGNATGPHVDYMYWNPQGQLTDGTKQPGFVAGRVTVGPQGQPLAPGQEGQAGQAPPGAPTMSQADRRAWLDTLPPPPGAQAPQPAGGAQPVADRSWLDAIPPPSPDDYRGMPGTRDASFRFGRDEPAPTPWDYKGQAGLRDAAFVYGRDEGPTFQQLSDTGSGARAMADGPAYPPEQGAYPPSQSAYPPAQSAYPPAGSAYPPAGSAYPPDAAGPNQLVPGGQPGSPGSTTVPMGTPGSATAPGGAPGGTPPGGGPPGNDTPEDVARRQDAERIRKENAEKYGIRDQYPPVEGKPSGDPSLAPLRADRQRENDNLIALGVKLAEAERKANEPPPDPASDPKGDLKAQWDKDILVAKQAAQEIRQQYNTQYTRVRQIDTEVGQAIAKLEAAAKEAGGPNNPITKEVIGPDGNPVTIQWDPKQGKWIELPGFTQGVKPTTVKVTPHDAGGYIALWDENGRLVGTAPKTLGPDQMEPQVIGASTGPKITIYNPRTGTVTTQDNPAYERKPTQITASSDSPYIVRQDPVTGKTIIDQNPNYNPYGKDNRIEGKGLGEGFISFVDPQGNVRTVDTLPPELRKPTQQGAQADIDKRVAEAEKLKLEADIKKKEQEAWDEIQAAIDAGATPGQVRGLVERAARSVDDYAKLRQAETQARTQTETARHNLATEAEGMRTRRTAEAAEARQGAESYGRYGVASAPFQTALLGSLSQVADPRQVGAKMNIDQGVIDPVANVFDQRQAEYQKTQERQDDLFKQGQEPWTQPYERPGASGTSGTSGTSTTQQPAGGTQQPAPGGAGGSTPASPTARVAGQTYTGKPTGENQAIDLKDQGKPGWARTYYDDNTYEDWQIPQASQPYDGSTPYRFTGNVVATPDQLAGVGLGGGQQGQPGGAPARRRRMPVAGKRAVPAGNGWVKTHYDDGSVETWHVEDGPSWEGVGGGGAGYWGEDPPTMYAGWEKGTVGGGGSLWTMPPSPSVSTAYGAETALAQAGQGLAPAQEQPAGTAGGFAGPSAQSPAPGGGGEGAPPNALTGGPDEYALLVAGQPGLPQPPAPVVPPPLYPILRPPEPPVSSVGPVIERGGGGGAFDTTGGYGASGPPPAAAGSGVFGTSAPPSVGGQRMAPMWDAATPAPFATSGVAGPSGGAGQATLYGSGASGGGLPAHAGGGTIPVNRATAPPRTNGSYYGGPGLPQAMSPLQRLLQQSGVIPLQAGRAAGAPGTV